MPDAVAPRSVRQDRASASDLGVGVIDPQERIEVLLAHLGTRASGLSSRDAERRVAQFGRNEISRTAQRSWVRELVRQLVHPLALLL
jgi:magnesium-transporting ATPase (P-type)